MDKKLIYIIDDEIIPIKVIEMILKEGDYEVKSYINVNEGLEAIINKPPDLVIMDFNMPNMNGFELMDQLTFRKVKTRIMICSGANEDSLIKRALIHGACDCINKANVTIELLEIVENLINDDSNYLPIEDN